jgi:hypothetical protein
MKSISIPIVSSLRKTSGRFEMYPHSLFILEGLKRL